MTHLLSDSPCPHLRPSKHVTGPSPTVTEPTPELCWRVTEVGDGESGKGRKRKTTEVKEVLFLLYDVLDLFFDCVQVLSEDFFLFLDLFVVTYRCLELYCQFLRFVLFRFLRLTFRDVRLQVFDFLSELLRFVVLSDRPLRGRPRQGGVKRHPDLVGISSVEERGSPVKGSGRRSQSDVWKSPGVGYGVSSPVAGELKEVGEGSSGRETSVGGW